MCLAVYVPQLILQEICSTVWVLGGGASGSSKVMSCVTRSEDGKMVPQTRLKTCPIKQKSMGH